MSNKEVFTNIVSTEIDKLSTAIQNLQNKMKDVSAETKSAFNTELEKITNKKKELESKIDSAKDIAEDASKEIKTGIEYGIDDLKKAIDQITSKFN
jgi:chromosome segregation ATPase